MLPKWQSLLGSTVSSFTGKLTAFNQLPFAYSIHAYSANGYLPAQFLDKESNQRTDKWGGSVENRARFYVESLDALCDVFGADRVGIKLNPFGGCMSAMLLLKSTKLTEIPFQLTMLA